MIVVSGQFTIKADQRDRAIAAASALVTATRAEPGCAEYAFASDLLEPEIFRFFERWESEEAIKAHTRSPHMAEFMKAAGELLDGPAGATRYEVSGSAPLF